MAMIEKAAQAILDELKRQADDRAFTVDGSPTDALIDGRNFDLSKVALAAIETTRDVWQDIASAPKTGERILAWNRLWSAPNTCQLYPRGWGPSFEEGPFKHQPTHWIVPPPIPEDFDGTNKLLSRWFD